MENNHYDSTGDVLNVKDRFAGHSVRRRVDGRRLPVMIAGVFCAVLAVICLSGFTYILFLHPTGNSMNSRYYAQAATKDISDNRADITLPLDVPDLDVRGSRVPIRVDGTLADGSEFGQDAFVSNDGKGLRLEPGSYEVYVMGSPISASGVMYIYPSEHINVVVSEDLTVSYDPVTFMTFGVLGALEVSDEQIEQARAFIVNDPDRMQYADTLAAAVRERRGAKGTRGSKRRQAGGGKGSCRAKGTKAKRAGKQERECSKAREHRLANQSLRQQHRRPQ